MELSYLVARMEKMKSQNLGGIQKHNQREFEKYRNEKIDIARSHLNYDLVNARKINYRQRVMNTIDAQRKNGRAVRKDAVLVNEWVITSDQEFFKDMDSDGVRSFFETAAAFFQNRYGKQNTIYAQVHLDETTPHMHLGVVPMKDGNLSSKNVFTRKELLVIQEELPAFMREKGFKVERGEENSKRKHLTVPEYKEMVSKLAKMASEREKLAEDINVLEEQKGRLEARLNEYKDYLEQYEEETPRVVGKKRKIEYQGREINVYTVPDFELIRMDAIRRASNEILAENKRLEKENEDLKASLKELGRWK